MNNKRRFSPNPQKTLKVLEALVSGTWEQRPNMYLLLYHNITPRILPLLLSESFRFSLTRAKNLKLLAHESFPLKSEVCGVFISYYLRGDLKIFPGIWVSQEFLSKQRVLPLPLHGKPCPFFN